MEISAKVNECNSIFDIQALLQDAEGNSTACPTTSWKGRFVEVVGYSGRTEIDAITSKAIEIIKEKNFEFSEQERSAGQAIRRQLSQLYDSTDIQLAQNNLFCRLAYCVRETFVHLLGSYFSPEQRHNLLMRREWRYGIVSMTPCSEVFLYYTVDLYREKFGHPPDRLEERSGYTNTFVFTALDSGRLPLLVCVGT